MSSSRISPSKSNSEYLRPGILELHRAWSIIFHSTSYVLERICWGCPGEYPNTHQEARYDEGKARKHWYKVLSDTTQTESLQSCMVNRRYFWGYCTSASSMIRYTATYPRRSWGRSALLEGFCNMLPRYDPLPSHYFKEKNEIPQGAKLNSLLGPNSTSLSCVRYPEVPQAQVVHPIWVVFHFNNVRGSSIGNLLQLVSVTAGTYWRVARTR